MGKDRSEVSCPPFIIPALQRGLGRVRPKGHEECAMDRCPTNYKALLESIKLKPFLLLKIGTNLATQFVRY